MKDIIGLILAVLILFGGCGKETPPATTEPLEPYIRIQGTQVRMHDDAAPILEALGQPIHYNEVTSCAFDGLDKTYYYGSFYLTTYPDDQTDRIHSVWFADDTIATEEGIRIGDTRDAVEAVYGAENFDGSGYVLMGAGSKLTILLTDNVVSSIQYEGIFP